jgi:hypothetical protein
VKDVYGMEKLLFKVIEDSSFCGRYCCEHHRGFKMTMADDENQDILRFERPFKCCGAYACSACCYPNQVHQLYIYYGEQYLGKILQNVTGGCCEVHFTEVWDKNETKLFQVEINNEESLMKPDGFFDIHDVNGSTVGTISQTNMENIKYKIVFPLESSPEVKALLIGTLIFQDFVYYEVKRYAADNGKRVLKMCCCPVTLGWLC